MHRITVLAAWLVVLLASRPGLAEAKKYDLSMEYEPEPGWKVQVEDDTSTSADMTFTQGKKILEDEDDRKSASIRYVQHVLEVEDGFILSQKLVFSKAKKVEDGKKSNWGFAGKTVLVTLNDAKDGIAVRYEDGSEPSDEDREKLLELVSASEMLEGAGDDESEMLEPGKPVAVGESWSPDPVKLAVDMLDLASGDDVVASSSSAVLKLESVTKKKGREYAVISGQFVLVVRTLGDIPLGESMKVEIDFAMTVALDPHHPDEKLEMKMIMECDSPIQLAPGMEANLEMKATSLATKKEKLLPAKGKKKGKKKN